MKLLLSIMFMLACNTIFAQNWNKNVNLTVEVKEIDSQYFMIPHFKVFCDTQNIQIHNLIYYGSEFDLRESKVYIQKLMGKWRYVNIYVPALKQDIYVEDLNKLRKFTSKDYLTDTIDLSQFVPLEPGKYKLFLEFTYYLNGSSCVANSKEYDFEVLHIPKNSIFFKEL